MNIAIENQIDKFISKIELGVSFFKDAGQLLVQMLDRDPHVGQEILRRNIHWLTPDVLSVFEKIGRDQLAVEAMFLPKHVAERMIGLPLEEQTRIATEPITVAPIREGHHPRVNRNFVRRQKEREPVTKMARDLTPRQAAIAIGPDGVRPLSEQTALATLPEVAERIVGCFELTVMNNKAFVKACEHVARAQKVKLDSRGQAVLEVVT